MSSSIRGAAQVLEPQTVKKRLKNMTIGKRIGLGFTFVLMLLAMTAIISIERLQTVAEATHAMMQQPLAKERLVSDWYCNVYSSIRRTSAIAKSADPSLSAFFAEEIAASSTSSSELQASVQSLLVTDREKALFKEIGEQRKVYVKLRDTISKAKADGQFDQANRLFEHDFVPTGRKYLDLLHELQKGQRVSIDATAREIDGFYHTGKRVLLTISIFALACGVVCAGFITRGVLKQLGGEPAYAAAIVGQIAHGNLSIAIETKANDQSSLLFEMKSMRDSLANIVAQARSGAETIAAASGQIASGNLDLSSRTELQASSLVETASSMDELTSTVRQNADNAHQANQLALSAAEVALKGGAVVSQVVETMFAINESSRKIVDIIGVIDSIAFQTNILALNAAVEAARAGEQGRGFAVVASEVRNLAQRSAAAAKEIKSLIGDSVEKVDVGARLVGQAGATMDEIVESVKRVTHIMSEITSASQEQTAGIEQINQAIIQMDEATQQNLTLVEQATAAAAELRDQAANLTQVVSVFMLDGVQVLAKWDAGLRSIAHVTRSLVPVEPKAGRARPA